MWFYWALFSVPALAAMSPARLTASSRAIVVFGAAVLLIVIIGLRDHVGADWEGYANILHQNEPKSLWELLTSREPGFGIISWLSIQFGWGVYGLNIFCSIIFVAGLVAFLLKQPNFWRALAFSIPVLVIQLGMSGIRQAAAIGVLFFALNAFCERRLIRFLFLVFLAFTLHQTAIVFAVLAMFIHGRIRMLPALAAGAFVLGVSLFLFKDADFYRNAYVLQDQGGAAGAVPRIAFNVLAAILFWRFRKQWAAQYPSDYRLFSILAIAVALVSPLVGFAQVAVDRLEYYLIPFQIAVISRVPEFLSQRLRTPFVTFSYAGYAAALAVWMNFSLIAQLAWMPYRTILFGAN